MEMEQSAVKEAWTTPDIVDVDARQSDVSDIVTGTQSEPFGSMRYS